MSKQNFIAGQGFSVEDEDGIVTSFLEVNQGNNIDLKNVTRINQNHTYLGDDSQKNNYIMVARTSFTTSIQSATLGDYTQTLGVFPELPNNSLNIVKANIVATNKYNTDYKFALNYDLSLLCVDDTIQEITDLQTSFVEDFPTGYTWTVVPSYTDRQVSFACTGNPGTNGQEVIWMIYLEIISSTFI